MSVHWGSVPDSSCAHTVEDAASRPYLLPLTEIELLCDPDADIPLHHQPLEDTKAEQPQPLVHRVEAACDPAVRACMQAVIRSNRLRARLLRLQDRCGAATSKAAALQAMTRDLSDQSASSALPSRCPVQLGRIDEPTCYNLLKSGVAASLVLAGFECSASQSLSTLTEVTASYLQRLCERVASGVQQRQRPEQQEGSRDFPDEVQRALAGAGIEEAAQLREWWDKCVRDNRRRAEELCKLWTREIDSLLLSSGNIVLTSSSESDSESDKFKEEK